MKKTTTGFFFLLFPCVLTAQSSWTSKVVGLPFSTSVPAWKDTLTVQKHIDRLFEKGSNVPYQDSIMHSALSVCNNSGLRSYAIRILNFWSQQKVSQDEIEAAAALVQKAFLISNRDAGLKSGVDYRDLLVQKILVHYYKGQFDSTQAFAVQGIMLSKEAKDLFNESIFTVQQAIGINMKSGDNAIVDSLFRKGKELALQTASLHDDAMSMHNYAFFLKVFPSQNLRSSLELLTSIQEFSSAAELKNNRNIPYRRSPFFFRGTHLMMLRELAAGYLYLGDFEQACYYAEQGTKSHAAEQGNAFLSRILIEQAYFETYIRPVSRIKLLLDSVEKLSLKYYGKKETPNSYLYYVKGWLSEAASDWPRAIDYYKKAIPFSETGVNENHIGLFRAYIKSEDAFHADSMYTAIERELGNTLIQYHRIYFYKELPAYYRLKKEEQEALKAAVSYYHLKDSMAGISNYLIASRFEKQFKTKEKDRLLMLAAKEKQVSQQQIAFQRRQTFFLAAGLLLLSFATALLIRNYRIKKKHALALEQKNKQIETLIRELHHRVKNNLQVVSGLLSLQANRLENEAARQAMDEGRTRVDAMAMIHQKLYMDKDLAAVDIKEYLENLSLSLADSFGYAKENVETFVDFPDTSMDIDLAIPIGLIVNELVTNAFKHAFTGVQDAKINISLGKVNDTMELKVADNGKGIPGMPAQSKSFGMKLVRTLVDQLNGTLQQQRDGGTVFIIQIRA